LGGKSRATPNADAVSSTKEGPVARETRFLAGFAVLLALLVGLVAVGLVNFRRLAEANRWSLHTYAVLNNARALQEAVLDMETDLRGFALTGDAAFAAQWSAHRREVRRHLDAGLALTHDNPPQQRRMARVDSLFTRWVAMQEATGLAGAGGPGQRERARQAAAGLAGLRARVAVMAQMRGALERFDAREMELLHARATRSAALERLTELLLLVGGSFAVTVALGLGTLVRRRNRTLWAVNAELAGEIAERRTAQRAAERLARQNRLILDSADEGICGVDVNGYVSSVNPAAGRLLGREADDAVGRPVETVLPLEDEHGERIAPVRETLGAGATRQVSGGTLRRADGASFAAELVSAPLVEEGRIVGAVVTFRDVSQRREVERMKDEFVSVVSHELRTPLTALRGSLGLLAGGRAGAVGEPAQRLLDIAVQNTDRLVRLINDILDLERIRAGRSALKPRPVPAPDLVRQAVELMDAVAARSRVRLAAQVAPVVVMADADRVLQVLTNLISNAVKFSPQGTEVRVQARPEGGEALFEVCDRGRGIPPDKLESIFGRFQQVDSSDSRAMGGTGLGLAICRGIVEEHGGRIWVESTLGEGSSFRFTLPLAQNGQTPRPPPTAEGQPQDASGRTG
jgi:PAS domain S-box-containing protein